MFLLNLRETSLLIKCEGKVNTNTLFHLILLFPKLPTDNVIDIILPPTEKQIKKLQD